MRNDVVIEYHLNSLGTEEVDQHIAHVYCHEGKCDLYYNDSHVSFSEGDSMILINSKLLDGISASDDFKCTVIYENCFATSDDTKSNPKARSLYEKSSR